MPNDVSSDLALLLSRVAMADRSAFQKLYDATAPKLFGSLLQLLRKPDLAEDALQETYIRVWKNAGQYRENSSKPMTWLYSIARYRAIDMLRKQKHENRNIELNTEGETLDSALTILDDLSQGDSIGLANCLAQLDKFQMDAVVKCYCEGYSHSELSRNLSKPLGTIKSWVRRGLQALKNCLEQ